MLRKGNLLMIGVCTFALLSELSVPGQFKIGFPFVTHTWDLAQQVPSATDKSLGILAQRLSERSEAIAHYQGIDITTVVERCDEPVPQTYSGFTTQQLAEFMAQKPVDNGWTAEQVTKALGPALCPTSSFTAVYVENGRPNSWIEVTFGSDDPEKPPTVKGFQYHGPTENS